MTRQTRETLFTVPDRSLITKACLHQGSWEGTRKGFMVTFQYDKHAPEGSKIVWGVCISRRWINGVAPMVSEAMQSVESKVFNREWEKRLAAMEEEA